eukprot:1182433-Prorocentrum_minimum.AAC.3
MSVRCVAKIRGISQHPLVAGTAHTTRVLASPNGGTRRALFKGTLRSGSLRPGMGYSRCWQQFRALRYTHPKLHYRNLKAPPSSSPAHAKPPSCRRAESTSRGHNSRKSKKNLPPDFSPPDLRESELSGSETLRRLYSDATYSFKFATDDRHKKSSRSRRPEINLQPKEPKLSTQLVSAHTALLTPPSRTPRVLTSHTQ